MKTSLSKATLGRLPEYLRYLKGLHYNDRMRISATAIARALSLGEVQVRKDLSAVSGAGKPKIGYYVSELVENLELCLGRRKMTSAILVGAGKLGRALLDYDGFEKYGIKIIAAFDCNEQVIKKGGGSVSVMPISTLESFCEVNLVRLGIITVGVGSAQEVCDRMIASGIEAIWNFAPCKLSVPSNVLLKQEDLALSLAHLNNKLCI